MKDHGPLAGGQREDEHKNSELDRSRHRRHLHRGLTRGDNEQPHLTGGGQTVATWWHSTSASLKMCPILNGVV